MMSKRLYRYEVACAGREPVRVAAVDRLRAIAAAAQEWGVRWTEIARRCEVQNLGPAPEGKKRRSSSD